MATRAYFFITSAADADHSRKAKWLQDLEALPEVRRVYRVLGRFDLLVTVEAAGGVSSVAARVLANPCVDRLVISFRHVGPALRPRAA